ncbi:MAG: hypothetical protein IJO40_13520, partial [Thermoguttaceae bacterium]|nr:hypothetical protein [Thermoguttaceae bacterium]
SLVLASPLGFDVFFVSSDFAESARKPDVRGAVRRGGAPSTVGIALKSQAPATPKTVNIAATPPTRARLLFFVQTTDISQPYSFPQRFVQRDGGAFRSVATLSILLQKARRAQGGSENFQTALDFA